MTGPAEQSAEQTTRTSATQGAAVGPVDRVLDELFDALAGTGGPGRRTVTEAEDHLRAAAAEGVAQGLSQIDAETAAVARFGDPSRLAAGIRRAHLDLPTLLRRAFTGTWFVGAVSLVAIGVSGLVSEVFGRVIGAGFVAGDASGVTYTAARCADYFEYFPNANSCADAAAQHHWGEVVQGRVAAGVLGLLALGVLGLARRTVLRGPAWQFPPTYVAAVLLALFGAAGVLLTGLSVMQLAFGSTSGVGANLSDGLVALLVALAVLIWSIRTVRRRVPA
jgi:hypothetical protein